MNRKRCDRKALLDEAQAVKRSASQLPASARDHLGPMLNQAAEHLAPYRDEAIEQAKAAKVKAANWAADRVEHFQPSLSATLDRVPDAVDKAQRKLQDDVIPGLVSGLHRVAGDSPVIAETAVVVVKRHRGRKVLMGLVLGLVAAAVIAAVRSWLAGRSNQWSTVESREAYVYPDDTVNSAEVADYETDSYIGSNPPAGFTIKANARSKKYHLPGSRHYDRTMAEVWFATEQAAQDAGFTKADD